MTKHEADDPPEQEGAPDIEQFADLVYSLDKVQQSSRSDPTGREAAIEALGAVILFLQGCPDIKRRSLHVPLINLLLALDKLNTEGIRDPMFAVPVASNALPDARARLHATAAAWAQALVWAKVKSADDVVARALAGYKLRGDKNNEVSASTVREWRKQANQENPSGLDPDQYRHMLGIFRRATAANLNKAFVLPVLRSMVPHLFD
jgi:hypothetical protein